MDKQICEPPSCATIFVWWNPAPSRDWRSCFTYVPSHGDSFQILWQPSGRSVRRGAVGTNYTRSSGLTQRSQFADRVHSSRLLPTLSRTVLSARGTEKGRPYCCVLQWQDRFEPNQQSSMADRTGVSPGCASSPLSSATCQQAHSHSRLAGMSDKAHNFQHTIRQPSARCKNHTPFVASIKVRCRIVTHMAAL